jgi:exonuclease I
MKTFYWYDFETFGINPKTDRISQFAGIRTDEALQGLKKSPIGQKLDFANHPYLCKGLNENAKSLKIIV